jgi:hypothetical protein
VPDLKLTNSKSNGSKNMKQQFNQMQRSASVTKNSTRFRARLPLSHIKFENEVLARLLRHSAIRSL